MQQKKFSVIKPVVTISATDNKIPMLTLISSEKHTEGEYAGRHKSENFLFSKGASDVLRDTLSANADGTYTVTPEFILENFKFALADNKSAGTQVWKVTRKSGENNYISLDSLMAAAKNLNLTADFE